MNADKIGKAVAKWCKSKAAYKVLDANPSTSGTTWQAGGCVLLAQGLHNILPGSKMLGLVVKLDKEWVPLQGDTDELIDHVGVLYQGRVIDADGPHESQRSWAKRWLQVERSHDKHVLGIRTVDIDKIDEEVLPLPNDREGAEMVSEALKPVLGISSAQRKALLLEVAANRIEKTMGTFTKLLSSVDRRQQAKSVELDLRQGKGELWKMSDEWEFITEPKKMTALGMNSAQLEQRGADET